MAVIAMVAAELHLFMHRKKCAQYSNLAETNDRCARDSVQHGPAEAALLASFMHHFVHSFVWPFAQSIIHSLLWRSLHVCVCSVGKTRGVKWDQ